MPSPKVRLKYRKKARAEKRKRAMQLTRSDVVQLAHARRLWKTSEWGLLNGTNKRRLEEIEELHGLKKKKLVNEKAVVEGSGFVGLLGVLRQRFPGKVIQVLDEGTGLSTFKPELLSEAERKFGAHAVRIETSDILPAPSKEAHVQAAPEELVKKFGRNRFHLIVSTYGGMSYSMLHPLIGLSNIVAVLKEGGEARLLITANTFRGDYAWGKAVEKLRKLHPHIIVKMVENTFEVRNPKRHTARNIYITIQK